MQLDRYAGFEDAEFGVIIFAEEKASVIGGAAVAGVNGVAEAGQEAVLFDYEKSDLSHAASMTSRRGVHVRILSAPKPVDL